MGSVPQVMKQAEEAIDMLFGKRADTLAKETGAIKRELQVRAGTLAM